MLSGRLEVLHCSSIYESMCPKRRLNAWMIILLNLDYRESLRGTHACSMFRMTVMSERDGRRSRRVQLLAPFGLGEFSVEPADRPKNMDKKNKLKLFFASLDRQDFASETRNAAACLQERKKGLKKREAPSVKNALKAWHATLSSGTAAQQHSTRSAVLGEFFSYTHHNTLALTTAE